MNTLAGLKSAEIDSLKNFPSRDEIKIGDIILLAADNNPISREIERFQLGKGFSREASCFVHLAASGGEYDAINPCFPFVHRSPNELLEFKNREFLVLRPKWQTNESRYKRGYYFASQCNLPYNFLGLFWFWIPDRIKCHLYLPQIGRFCSQLIARGFELNNELDIITKKKPAECYPADFYRPDIFDIIFDYHPLKN